MTVQRRVRPAESADWPAVEALYPAAFPAEDLVPLVRALSACEDCRHLIIEEAGAVLGHAAFTLCGVEEQAKTAALIGPVVVAPSHHLQGLGAALIEAALADLAEARISRGLVLGDPAYYGRFGFTQEMDIKTPFPIPAKWEAAWQSVALHDGAAVLAGQLRVPKPWLDPALWAP